MIEIKVELRYGCTSKYRWFVTATRMDDFDYVHVITATDDTLAIVCEELLTAEAEWR